MAQGQTVAFSSLPFAGGFLKGIAQWRAKRVMEKLNLQTIRDPRGSLTVLERLPFDIRRVYYLHGVDPNATRGGHAHKALDRVMIAVAGGFKVTTFGKRVTGEASRWSDTRLDDPTVGLRIRPMEWVELSEFAPGSICLVLASLEHDEADCIRDFADFTKAAR